MKPKTACTMFLAVAIGPSGCHGYDGLLRQIRRWIFRESEEACVGLVVASLEVPLAKCPGRSAEFSG